MLMVWFHTPSPHGSRNKIHTDQNRQGKNLFFMSILSMLRPRIATFRHADAELICVAVINCLQRQAGVFPPARRFGRLGCYVWDKPAILQSPGQRLSQIQLHGSWRINHSRRSVDDEHASQKNAAIIVVMIDILEPTFAPSRCAICANDSVAHRSVVSKKMPWLIPLIPLITSNAESRPTSNLQRPAHSRISSHT